ncbi:MAG: dynamin family protein [Selenomonadaceae bacterium]|nr:dynamin family protein [Selenomonadaceae bacterium]
MSEEYRSYQAMARQTLQGIADISKICEKLGLEKSNENLSRAKERLQSKEFTVGILGEFKRGKSAVINSLLGKKIVPEDPLPCSATLNYIRYDSTPGAVVNYKDGRKETVSVDNLKDYVTKLTDESAAVAENIQDVVVQYPCKFCKDGAQIVDTPGLNDEETMTNVTESVVPYLDAILLVVVPGSPFSESEANFVRTKIMTSDIGRMVVVINKMDQIDEEDRARVIEGIRKKFGASVLEKIADTYGKDSNEYLDAKSKVGELKVIGVSAKQAFKAKQEASAEKLAESNWQELEDSLSWILNEERGSIELISPVNTLLSTAKEAHSTIEMRLSASNMEEEKLNELTEKGIVEAQHSREMMEEEIQKLKKGSENIYNELLPEVQSIYSSTQQELLEYVNNVVINPADISNNSGIKRTSDKIAKELNDELNKKLSAGVEVLGMKVQQRVNEDLSKFSDKVDEIFGGMVDVQKEISAGETGSSFTWGIAAFDTLTNISGLLGMGFFGLGGLISGFRANGVKGALVGGFTGFVSGYAASYAVVAAGASVIGLPILIPALAVGGVISTFGGKYFVNKIFGESIGQRNMDKVRNQLKDSVISSMNQVQKEMVIEKWLRQTARDAYNHVVQKLDTETKNAITDFEHTMTQLRLDKQKKQSEIDAIREDLKDWSQQLQLINENIAPVKAKLIKAMGGEQGE